MEDSMKRSKWQTTLLLAIVLAVAPGTLVFAARARARRGPAIGYAYPAGGRQGTTFEVAIAGRFLDGVTDVVTSGQGIRATVIEHVKPLNGKQINLLRDRLKELQKKVKPPKKGKGKNTTDNEPNNTSEPVTEKDLETMEKEMAEIKEKLANPKNRNRSNPQLSEDVTLRVVLAPDAEPGERELRLKTAQGLSNPVAFYVGQLPEYAEKEPKNKKADTEVLSELP